jgi:hypothetical protein
MRKETNLKLNIPFEEALERLASVNIKDISEIEEASNIKKPAPFVKWVGGKRFLMQKLVKRLPKDLFDFRSVKYIITFI